MWSEALAAAYLFGVTALPLLVPLTPFAHLDLWSLLVSAMTYVSLVCSIAVWGMRYLFEWFTLIALILTLGIAAIGALACLAAVLVSPGGRLGRRAGIIGLALGAGMAVADVMGSS